MIKITTHLIYSLFDLTLVAILGVTWKNMFDFKFHKFPVPLIRC